VNDLDVRKRHPSAKIALAVVTPEGRPASVWILHSEQKLKGEGTGRTGIPSQTQESETRRLESSLSRRSTITPASAGKLLFDEGILQLGAQRCVYHGLVVREDVKVVKRAPLPQAREQFGRWANRKIEL